MPSFRYRTALLLGPWRSSPEDALEDAVRRGVARRVRGSADAVEWLFPGEIEQRPDDADEGRPPD